MNKLTSSFRDLVAEAEKEIETLSPAQVRAALDSSTGGLLLVDLRDVREVKREGRIAGSLHIPRGMLEFWIDPASPYHKEIFNQDKTYVFYCASAWRSALSAKVAQDMGLAPVAHIAGGFTAWLKADGPVETLPEK